MQLVGNPQVTLSAFTSVTLTTRPCCGPQAQMRSFLLLQSEMEREGSHEADRGTSEERPESNKGLRLRSTL